MSKPKVKFGIPTKLQIILLLVIGTVLFFVDINQNKVLDLGLYYQTTWFGTIMTSAIVNFWIGIFVYLGLYMTLVAIEIKVRKSHPLSTVIISMLAIFGIGFLLLGFFTELYNVQVPFFHILTQPINIYHTGIALSILAPIAIVLTD